MFLQRVQDVCSSRVVKECVCLSLSHVQLFATPWKVAHQAPLSVEFSRQEYWSGLPFPSPGDLSNPGIKPGSPSLQAVSMREHSRWQRLKLQGFMAQPQQLQCHSCHPTVGQKNHRADHDLREMSCISQIEEWQRICGHLQSAT